jgi:hypothetical protein
MKRLAIRLDGVFHKDRALEDDMYQTAYCELGTALEKKGVDCVLVKDDRTWLGGNAFASGWRLREDRTELVTEPFTADLVFCKDKSFRPDERTTLVQSREFDALCNDKQLTYNLFPHLSPRTIRVDREEDLVSALESLRSAQAVLKPLTGYGGDGVYIGPKDQAPKHVPGYPCLVQEFIDTSGGIPGVIGATHDFRIILVNGEVIFTFIRTPRHGSLISNFSLGGWMMPVPTTYRPEGALAMAAEVDAELARFGNRHYCVDVALDRDGTWKLIELNAPPGAQNRMECGNDANEYFEKLSDFFARCMP